jgi:hypothetical protein
MRGRKGGKHCTILWFYWNIKDVIFSNFWCLTLYVDLIELIYGTKMGWMLS